MLKIAIVTSGATKRKILSVLRLFSILSSLDVIGDSLIYEYIIIPTREISVNLAKYE